MVQCVIRQELDIGVDISKAEKLIYAQANASIDRDTSKWATEHVSRPSRFIRSPNDPLFAENEELIRKESRLLNETQLEDGSWPVTWHWSSYPESCPIAQEWWKPIIVIENIQFQKNMDELGKG